MTYLYRGFLVYLWIGVAFTAYVMVRRIIKKGLGWRFVPQKARDVLPAGSLFTHIILIFAILIVAWPMGFYQDVFGKGEPDGH